MNLIAQSLEHLAPFSASVTKLNILVVGDLIFDEYRYCSPVGTTTKAPVISSIARGFEVMLGGAAAVARHCSNFAGNVDLLTRLNKGDVQEFRRLLSAEVGGSGVNFFIEDCSTTPRKVRYISAGYPNTLNKEADFFKNNGLGQKLFEVSYLPEVSNNEDGRLRVPINFRDYDLVIVMDFGHGFLTQDYWCEIRSKARFVALNVQTNSTNYGFNLVTKYKGADLVCLDELEARLACMDRDSEFDELFLKLRSRVDAKYICITRGSEGLALGDDLNTKYEFPAVTEKVVDPVGAGDAVLSFVSMSVACGLPIDLIGKIASSAGAAACQIVGNRSSISIKDLQNYLREC